jgi:hypothetical protein
MKATRQLHDPGQSPWLDNISRNLPDDGAPARCIAADSIAGLTSGPNTFGAQAFVKPWQQLLLRTAGKTGTLNRKSQDPTAP